jgi:hypothetical protein
MTFTKMASLQHRSVSDEAMDACVDWREECIAGSDASLAASGAGRYGC